MRKRGSQSFSHLPKMPSAKARGEVGGLSIACTDGAKGRLERPLCSLLCRGLPLRARWASMTLNVNEGQGSPAQEGAMLKMGKPQLEGDPRPAPGHWTSLKHQPHPSVRLKQASPPLSLPMPWSRIWKMQESTPR